MSPTATSRSHKHLLTPWSKQGAISTPTITRAKGSYLYDDEGRRYLDLSAGLVAVNLGHGHPAVTEAIKRQLDKVAYVAPSLMNDTRSEFAELLSDIAPWGEGSRVFFTTNGGEANEDALKMARMLTGRHKVLAAYRS
ncbi:MAG TPA: aminotransferase class III-fold pyridoxal phosphate-dependent enzyme, partial [Trueperaceae bacterium]|nr:aminotransferase class III-fold pyridoxal phosphate-dependent enzyme [Trueperaceae bacterium]